MTKAQLRTLVQAYAEVDAQAYITAQVDLDRLMEEQLGLFCELTYCLYDSAVPFTPQVGETIYDLRGDRFDKVVIWPTQVMLSGVALKDLRGRPGPVAVEVMQAAPTGVNGTPTWWCRLPVSNIQFNKAFVVTGYGHTVSGFVRHSALTYESQELEIREPWVRTLARFIAMDLLDPKASGTSLEKVQRLDAKTKEEMLSLCRQVAASYPGVEPPLLGMLGGKQSE